jgi:hypothetical protein
MRNLFVTLLGFAGALAPAQGPQPIEPFPPAGHKLIGDMVVPNDFGLPGSFHRANSWPNALVPYTFDAALYAG